MIVRLGLLWTVDCGPWTSLEVFSSNTKNKHGQRDY